MLLVSAGLTAVVLAGCGSDGEGQATESPAAAAPSAAPLTASPSSTASPSLTPESKATAATALAASEPVAVTIDALGVQQEIVALGLTGDGVMEVPRGPDPVGWYERSPTPGETGPAVLAGHVTWNGTAGVFRHLKDLAAGDRVSVQRADGTTAMFAVTRVEQYPKDTFPTAQVYGNTPGPELRLITCAGDYDQASNGYSDNTVVYAELV